MNLLDELQRDRLDKNLQFADERMAPFRRSRYQLIADYIGQSFPKESVAGTGLDTEHGRIKYINQMHQTAEAYTMALAANCPRFRVAAKRSKLNYFRTRFELALNCWVGEMEMEQVLQRAVLDAFFMIGIVKVYQGDHAEVEVENDVRFDPGRPAIANISLDNFIVDLNTDVRRARFASDYYELPMWKLKDSRFDKKVADTATVLKRAGSNANGEAFVANMAKQDQPGPDDLEDMVGIRDVWLPQDNMIATFLCNRSEDGKMHLNGKPLSYEENDGPEFGPYHYLTYGDVPENVFGISLAANLDPLFLLTESLMRKLAKQARKQKDFFVVTSGDKDDVNSYINAGQGDFVHSNNPEAINQVSVGGMNQATQMGMQSTLSLGDRMAGNLQAMAGLGAQTGTVGQEQIINGTIGQRLAKMLSRTGKFASGIGRDVGHLLWLDSWLEMPLEIKVPGSSMVERTHWTPEDREGDFIDYNFDVDVEDMPYRSQESKFAAAMGQLDKYLAAAQLMQPAGVSINWEAVHKAASETIGLAGMDEWLTFSQPSMDPDPAAFEGNRKMFTARKPYEHVHRSEATQTGKDSALAQMMSSAANDNGSSVNAGQVAQVM